MSSICYCVSVFNIEGPYLSDEGMVFILFTDASCWEGYEPIILGASKSEFEMDIYMRNTII